VLCVVCCVMKEETDLTSRTSFRVSLDVGYCEDIFLKKSNQGGICASYNHKIGHI
jgi:hypothetical protein